MSIASPLRRVAYSRSECSQRLPSSGSASPVPTSSHRNGTASMRKPATPDIHDQFEPTEAAAVRALGREPVDSPTPRLTSVAAYALPQEQRATGSQYRDDERITA